MPRPAPTDDELRVSAVYRRLVAAGGGARYAELVGRPHDRAVLSHLVRRGLALKVGHGTYALPAAQPDLVVAARFDAHVDCVSALRLQDVTVLDPPTRTHLLVPRGRNDARRPGRELHRVRLHRSDEELGLAVMDGRVRSVERALARAVRCLPRDDAVVALDSALFKKLATVEGVRRHIPANAPSRVWSTLTLGDAGGESIIETLARLALLDAGYSVRTQAKFRGVGRVDLLVEGRVVVELDGYEFHSSRWAFRNDRYRDRALHAGGLVVLRFTYGDVMDDPDCVVRAVRAAFVGRRPDFEVIRPYA